MPHTGEIQSYDSEMHQILIKLRKLQIMTSTPSSGVMLGSSPYNYMYHLKVFKLGGFDSKNNFTFTNEWFEILQLIEYYNKLLVDYTNQ